MSSSTDSRIRVLQGVPPLNDAKNPYLLLLEQTLSADFEVNYYEPSAVVLGRFDVVHVQWPESLVRSRGVFAGIAKKILYVVLLVQVLSRRIPVVRTAHNIEAHEPLSRLEQLLLRPLEARVAVTIHLSEATLDSTGPGAHVVIPHGRYAVLPEVIRVDALPGHVVFFGKIRAYKNVDRLISAFTQVAESGATLTILGEPQDEQIGQEIRQLAAGDSRVDLMLGHVPEAALQAEVRRGQLVALPYTEMANSGALLMALSLGRPVLVPRTPVNELLAAEVGAEWVQVFDGQLEPSDILNALQNTSSLGSKRPNLDGRAWEAQRASFRDVYERALNRR